MFDRWNDIDRTFAAMDELRRRMDRAFGWDTFEAPRDVGPTMVLKDEGPRFVLRAEVPGLTEKELDLQLTHDVLTVKGERRVQAPEGFSVHRQERRPFKFSRSFTLPERVDAETITASLEDGVLTVTLPKAPESRPRQITVKAA
jgi:HSP20 family protein